MSLHPILLQTWHDILSRDAMYVIFDNCVKYLLAMKRKMIWRGKTLLAVLLLSCHFPRDCSRMEGCDVGKSRGTQK